MEKWPVWLKRSGLVFFKRRSKSMKEVVAVVPWFVDMISLKHLQVEHEVKEFKVMNPHAPGAFIASVGSHVAPWWMFSKSIGSWWQPTRCWHPIYLPFDHSWPPVVFCCDRIFVAQIGDLSPNAFSDAGLKRDMLHPSIAQHKYLWLPTVSSIDPQRVWSIGNQKGNDAS